MSCDCFKRTLDSIKEKYPEWSGKKVKDMRWSDDAISFPDFKTHHQIGIAIEFEGQKKLGHTALQMAYCPICGECFDEPEPPKEEI